MVGSLKVDRGPWDGVLYCVLIFWKGGRSFVVQFARAHYCAPQCKSSAEARPNATMSIGNEDNFCHEAPQICRGSMKG